MNNDDMTFVFSAYYNDMDFEDLEEIYENLKKQIGHKNFIDCDNPRYICTWWDDDACDVFMDKRIVRETTDHERIIYETYWRRKENQNKEKRKKELKEELLKEYMYEIDTRQRKIALYETEIEEYFNKINKLNEEE